MNGWLIYTPEGALRNGQFIAFWQQAAKKRGVSLRLLLTGDQLPAEKPAFAVVRAIDPPLSKRLEEMGVAVYNPACVSEICNDKWKTYCLAEKLGVPFPETAFVPDPAQWMDRDFPYVLKACGGHGGTQVFWVGNEQQRVIVTQALRGIPSVRQKPVSDVGRDVRVYVLGDRILAAMLRTSAKDFRSNFCLGGHATPYTLSEREVEMVRAFQAALPLGLAGIDFIFQDGKAVFNEIEDVVGCRMLYSMTDVQPVEQYMDWIILNVNAHGVHRDMA